MEEPAGELLHTINQSLMIRVLVSLNWQHFKPRSKFDNQLQKISLKWMQFLYWSHEYIYLIFHHSILHTELIALAFRYRLWCHYFSDKYYSDSSKIRKNRIWKIIIQLFNYFYGKTKCDDDLNYLSNSTWLEIWFSRMYFEVLVIVCFCVLNIVYLDIMVL